MLAQSLSLYRAVYGEPAQADAGDFARKLLGKVLRQFFSENLTSRQGIVTEYARRLVVRNGNEGLRYTAPLMLLRGLPKPSVKRRARERASVVASS